MNSSCIGPILPVYINQNKWLDIFKNYLNDYGLISPVIEFPPFNDRYVKELKKLDSLKNLKNLLTIPFAHTYFIALNKKAIKEIIRNDGLPKKDIDKNTAVGFYERFITSILVSKGFKIKCLLSKFDNLDITQKNINKIFFENVLEENFSKNVKDPEIPNDGYFGSDLNPYEVIFFKNIRYQHSHRGKQNSGISENNTKFLNYIIGLNKNRYLFKNKREIINTLRVNDPQIKNKFVILFKKLIFKINKFIRAFF